MTNYDATLASSYTFRLSVTTSSQSTSANTSVVSCVLSIIKGTGTGRWDANGNSSWSATVNGTTRSGSGISYDFRNYTTLTLASWTQTVSHNSDGTKSFSVSASWTNPSGNLGNGSVSGSYTLARIPGVPGQVGTPSFSSITPTTFTVSWPLPSAGHAAIIQYDLHVCDNTNETGSGCVFYNWTGSTARSRALTGATPNKKYYARVRAQNSDGSGAWSSWASATTLSADPPTVSGVVPSADGRSAVVSLGAPSGISVSSYTVEYTNTATGVVTTVTSTSSPVTVTGLTPGATYKWRARFVTGSYTSEYSGYTTVTQPKPSTNAGDYFDGSSSAQTDITYSWEGTANADISYAAGVVPLGWWLDWTTGKATYYRSTLGAFPQSAGDYAMKVVVTADVISPSSLEAGTGNVSSGNGFANVASGASYVGSIYVKLDLRSQRVAPVLVWYDGDRVEVGRVVGTPVVLGSGVWQRLSVSGVVPVGAGLAAIRITDVDGDGWSPWLGGETFNVDAAMISLGQLYPYFDGSTADTATYDYVWESTAHNSPSYRAVSTTDTADPLVDPDCEIVPAPPRPPVVPSDCIIDVGQWRRFWVVIPAEDVLDWAVMVPTLEIETTGEAVRQVRIRYYPNPFEYDPTEINTDEWCAEQIVSYIPADTVFRIDGMLQRVFASVSGGGSLNADHLLYGTDGIPATWPGLTCGIEHVVSLDVPLPAGEDQITVRTYLTARR